MSKKTTFFCYQSATFACNKYIFLKITSIFLEVLMFFYVGYLIIEQHYFLTLWLLNRLGEYWFCIFLYVYDCNRQLAPILRQRLCSLMYDVMMFIDLPRWWWLMYNELKIPGIQSRVRTEYFLWIVEQLTKKRNSNKAEWKSNNTSNAWWLVYTQ
jgi:succinate dehydrogenase hydrophobic anchor subunit